MNATATKGIWTEKLPKGYSMEINTDEKKIRVFGHKKVLETVDIRHEIYPQDVENVRKSMIENFNLDN